MVAGEWNEAFSRTCDEVFRGGGGIDVSVYEFYVYWWTEEIALARTMSLQSRKK